MLCYVICKHAHSCTSMHWKWDHYMCCNWQKPMGTNWWVPFRWIVRVTWPRREWCIYNQVWVGVYLLGEGARHRLTGGYHPPLWLKLLHCCPGLIRKANSCFQCRGVGSSLLSHVLEEICLFVCFSNADVSAFSVAPHTQHCSVFYLGGFSFGLSKSPSPSARLETPPM